MFDARRFARLAVAEWTENRRAWAWFLGVLVILHFLVVLVIVFADNYASFWTEAQRGLFYTGLYCTGPIFAARHFRAMTEPSTALLALMRPATAFEKWLLAFLVVGVAFPLAYHLVFFICDVPAALLGHATAEAETARRASAANEAYVAKGLAEGQFAIYHMGRETARGLAGLLLILTTLQAFALTGTLLFRKAPFLKTLLAGFVILLVCLVLYSPRAAEPDLLLEYWSADQRLAPWQDWAYPATWLAVPALMWLAAWLALREREIA